MKAGQLTVKTPDELERLLTSYISAGACPGHFPSQPTPLEDVIIELLLPNGRVVELTGRAISRLANGQFLVELLRAGNLAANIKGLASLGPVDSNDSAIQGHSAVMPERVEVATSIVDTAEPEPDEPTGPQTAVELPPDTGELSPAAQAINARLERGVTGNESEYSDLYKRIQTLSLREKQQLARRGAKTARALLARDPNKTIHILIVMNPKVSLEEIEEFAKMPQFSKDALRHITQNRTWMSSRQLIFNLVRNPSTPVDIAVNLVPKLGPTEWRALNSSSNVRPQVASTARKLLIGRSQGN